MASTLLPPAGLALHGAPDASMTAHEPASAVQCMQLEMTEEVVDELLKSIRSGKAPQLLFGRNPILKYGETKRVLETASEKYRSELYRTHADSKDGMAFAGLVSHRLGVRKAQEVTAGADEALATLKNTMESMKKDKQAHIAKAVLGGGRSLSYPSSPALGSTAASPVPGRAPTSAPTSHLPSLQQAIRKPLLHLLAIRPARPTDLVQKLRAPRDDVLAVLRKIARPMGTDDSGEWKLDNKSFKELDVWKFSYPTGNDRQAAIDNAVKAFDRQRLDPQEKEWQLLLPAEERGKGKSLSRLHLGGGEGAEKAPTPLMKPKVNLKKALAAPKKEVKKRAEKADKAEDKEVKAAARKSAKAAQDGREAKAPPVKRTAPAVKKPAQQTNGSGARVAKPRSTQPKITQRPSSFTSTKRVQESNKPKNPSPLSASPPVNASDLEDNHPAHKALSASSSSSKSTPLNSDKHLKRRANDLDDDIHKHDVGIKRAKATHAAPAVQKAGTTTSAGAAPSTSTNLKRKAPASDQHDGKRPAPAVRPPKPATHARSTSTSNGNGNTTNGHSTTPATAASAHGATQRASSATTPTSSPSPEPLSMRQTVELSLKFKAYHRQYEAFYMQLCKQAEITAEEREKCLGMHRKLEEMKREIQTGARGVVASGGAVAGKGKGR
ncbi:hypothetical protein K490DRAFT_33388 [Saccharata proteae CBS 121410]|uniref:Uncharacterized protein n=1 Tax=Saccharata proteae CBS 121410 TaxID=1314787 RepID=A0A9P4I3J6_9PEZI|nr:hypothetical protein K490DRAFT_33388 [Saccharata proteae CBS 121410]